jgi:hypothetical protein
MEDDMLQKRCNGPCGRVLPATTEYFHRHKQGGHGVRAVCKECRKARNASPEVQEYHSLYNKAYRDNHPELKEQKRVYYARPDVQEHVHAYQQVYYNRPGIRERERARTKAWSCIPKNVERKRAVHQAYYRRPEIQERARHRVSTWYHNPENRAHIHTQRQVNVRNRDARKRAVPGKHTVEQIQDLLKRQHYRCYYCSAKFQKVKGNYTYHVDHTFPLSRIAGTGIPANDIGYLVLACPTCNMHKHDKFPWEWPEGGRLL